MPESELITIIDRFARYQNECADLFIEIAESLQPRNPKLAAICGDQFNFMAARSNSLIELVKINALWDAQILVRPIIESCVKVCFLCFSPEEQRPKLCLEYEETLGVINTLKLHDKALKTLGAVEGTPHPMLEALLLPEDKLKELREKVPKEVRKDIESRWGFTRMVVTLDQSFKSHFQISPFSSLLHTYGLSSHLIHADETGLGTIRARGRLEEPRLSVITASHHIALLDAMAGASMMTAISLAWAAQANIDDAICLIQTYERVHDGSY